MRRFGDFASASEVAFHLDEEALCKISPYANRDENRARIEETASIAYSRLRGPQSYSKPRAAFTPITANSGPRVAV